MAFKGFWAAMEKTKTYMLIILIILVFGIVVITLVNLRGIRESGTIFMLPTYVFLVAMVAFGIDRDEQRRSALGAEGSLPEAARTNAPDRICAGGRDPGFVRLGRGCALQARDDQRGAPVAANEQRSVGSDQADPLRVRLGQ